MDLIPKEKPLINQPAPSSTLIEVPRPLIRLDVQVIHGSEAKEGQLSYVVLLHHGGGSCSGSFINNSMVLLGATKSRSVEKRPVFPRRHLRRKDPPLKQPLVVQILHQKSFGILHRNQ